MRYPKYAAALLCACAAPASATVLVDFQMSGPVTGSFSVYLSGPNIQSALTPDELLSCEVSGSYVCQPIDVAPEMFGTEDYIGFGYIDPITHSGSYQSFLFDLDALLTPGVYAPWDSSPGFSAVLTVTDAPQIPDTAAIGYVPEPTTWAMMLLGFSLTGFALRRSTKRPDRQLRRSLPRRLG